MAAAQSSVTFFGGRSEQEIQNQMLQQQPNSSTATLTSSIASTTAPPKKRRNQSSSNSDAEVVALTPKTLMATNRFICEVCNKGFQREQNLQLHRRGHNLPWKLKQKNNKDPPKRKVFLCPEPTCVHHDPSRALGDLTGIKKHYSRKHGEKKWKCEKCSKRYAVQSDWKAHSKTCGTREYRCECGTLFSRRDSLITHRAFCDALAQETARHPTSLNTIGGHQMYGNSHVNLGLSQMGAQFSTLQNHPSTNNMLRLGHTTPKIENLISISSNPNSFGNPTQSYSPSTFFLQDHHSHNQAFQSDHHHHHNHHHHHHQQQQPFLNKPSHSLSQLPDLQTNNNNNNSSSADIFNLGFFSNNGNNGNIRSDQFSLDGGNPNGMPTMFSSIADHMTGPGAMSSLYGGNNSSVRQDNNNLSPHMSATALLQKAAQIDSTSSLVDGPSLLRSLRNSATRVANNKSDDIRELSTTGFGGDHMVGNESHHDHHLEGLMNSLANNGGSSNVFGGFMNALGGGSLDDPRRNLCDDQLDQGQELQETNNYNSKLHQNLGVSFGSGSDKLTLDFLGVGEIVRNMQGGGISSTNTAITSLDAQLKSTQQSQLFGGTTSALH
ncbi:protein indeterminate-domain 4, chloroplastic [Humulus lupulus]|uniref:protein indeterminate-domain 4, chloroplastic n=1 Tax=Humulus lupulus TaxID=3486 RepID=UPI002B401E0C|nr:protein indeterminate-domain 4, chloroplastic [Humulus lupulus]